MPSKPAAATAAELQAALPDDVLVGLTAREALGGDAGAVEARFAHVRAAYDLEGRWTPCEAAAAWHFNVHPEHVYDLHADTERRCDAAVGGLLCCG